MTDEDTTSTLQAQGKVVHNYHDYANEQAKGTSSQEQQHVAEELAHTARGADQNFPVKLHYMLAELEADGMDSIVSWQPHGRCFIVHRQTEFVEKVLPLWFRQSKFPSFQRQLNLYGFKRLTTGRDKGAYYHELFLRNKRFMSHRIQRIKIKGKGARKPSSPETEPSFYEYPFLAPTKMMPKVTRPFPPSNMFGPAVDTNMGTRAALSLNQILSSPALLASFQQSQQQRQMPPQYGTLPLYNVNGIADAFKVQQLYQAGRVNTQQQDLGLLATLGRQSTPTAGLRSLSNQRHMLTMNALRAQGVNENAAAAFAASVMLQGNELR